MESEIIKFAERIEERKNSARAKLSILVYGIQDAPEIFSDLEGNFKEEHYAYDNGNWGISKSRLVPTEMLLPGDIIVKLHIRPDSPLTLAKEEGRIFVKNGTRYLTECMFLDRPIFWNYTTSRGTPTKNIAQLYGHSALNFNIFSGCEFHRIGKGCTFCSVRETVDKSSPIKKIKQTEELAETCELATKYDQFRYLIMTGGSYIDRNREFDRNVEILKSIRYKLPWNGQIKGNVSFLPPDDCTKLSVLAELQVENPSFNMEVWDKKNFLRICPGKEAYVGFDHIVESLIYLTGIYNKGMVWSNFVAGIIPLADIKEGFKFMAEHGIVPGANIYHAEVGSSIGKSMGTIDENYIRDLYSYAAELYHKFGYKPYFDAAVLRNSLANEFYEELL